MELAKKVAVYIREHKLIEPGDRVLAALSGGADSVCLTLILNGLQTELGFTLSACHINHSLRGEESEADQAFVEDLCLRLRIPLTVVRVDVKGCAAEQGIGIEAAARLLRYETFEKLSDQRGFNKTALAHNRNDQAETILFRFLRGSSSKGLAGMRPMRDGRYIRPLLHTDRQTIEDFFAGRRGKLSDRLLQSDGGLYQKQPSLEPDPHSGGKVQSGYCEHPGGYGGDHGCRCGLSGRGIP